MARIKYSALVSDIRGIVGGNVFSRNKGGGYVRTFVKPNNPQTEAQQIQRLILGSIATEWRQLTEQQRTNWNLAALDFPYKDKLGEDKTYSGQQLFMKLNSTLVAIGQPFSKSTPSPVEMPSGIIQVDDNDYTQLAVSLKLPAVPANKAYIVRATRPLSPGRMNAFRQEFKQIASGTITAALFTIMDISAYPLVFDLTAANVGDKIFVEAVIVDTNTGQATAPLKTSFILTE